MLGDGKGRDRARGRREREEGTASETETKENGGRGGTGRAGARQQVCIRSSPSTLPNGLAHLFYIRPIGIGWRSFTEGLTLKGWLLIKYTVQEYHFGILGS